MNTTLLTLITVGVTSVLTGSVAWLAGRRKDEATTTDLITQAAQRVVEALSDDNTRLRVRLAELVVEVAQLTHQAAIDNARCEASLAVLRADIAELKRGRAV